MKLFEARKVLAIYITEPIAKILARTGITPSAISWFGFILVLGAAVLITGRHLFAAGVVALVGSAFDMLDGALARHTHQVTSFGAVLDSTLDRMAEAALLIGILFLYASEQQVAESLLTGAAIFSSLIVSYIRARAEGLGLDCQVGLCSRTERIILLVLGLLLNQVVIALAIIVILSFFTAGQRLIYVWQQTRGQG